LQIGSQNGDLTTKVVFTLTKVDARKEGVDTGLMTDLLVQAANDTYDVALLLTDDADYISTVTAVQGRFAKKVIHVGFGGPGSRLRRSSWAHLAMDAVAADLRMRKPWIGAAQGVSEDDVSHLRFHLLSTIWSAKCLKVELRTCKIMGHSLNSQTSQAFRTVCFTRTKFQRPMIPKALKRLSIDQELFVKITAMTPRGPRLTMKSIDQKTGKERPVT
jgi:hypothetical protein